MSKKLGRPTSSPKDKLLQVRLDSDTMEKLDQCVELEKSNRSEVVRKSLQDRYDKIKK